MEDDPEQGLFTRIISLIKKKTHLGHGNDLTEEIHDLMDQGHAKGLISDEESHMVSGVLDLKETKANSIMIPRTEIISASVNFTLSEVIKLVVDCGHTRIPIHNENIDEIVGILHAKDLLKLRGEGDNSRIPPEILRSPYFVPGTLMASELLKNLKEKKNHLAIVTDEYGGTAGIITIEDILEEIVGEIMDEHDKEQALLKVLDNGSLLVDARLEIERLEQHLNTELPKGDFESVGGLIIHLAGRIPQVNEKISLEGLDMIIQRADKRKIQNILITRKPRSDSLKIHDRDP
ncbi:MAG: HlyC/CorC family transporter [Desulfobacterales bacterium]|nr:HlyC/CorC family transporter [Desulfobacterales bacterium]